MRHFSAEFSLMVRQPGLSLRKPVRVRVRFGYNRSVSERYIGPYRIEEEIGSGGMGAVYKAWDTRLERWVAIKAILSSRELSTERLERFRREARSNARINHPAIAQVYDIITEDGRDHIVMELIEGSTLEQLLKSGPLTPKRAVFIAQQITEGLGAAHAHGLIHRDLKAANVMVTTNNRAKILDFGLAKVVETDPGTLDLTEEGMVIGTCRAMSPEQAEGQRLDHRSDLFALGSLFFRMVTGQHPFAAATAVATMHRVVYEEPSPARSLNPDVPVELSDFIARLLRKKKAERPKDAHEVGAELLKLSAMWAGPTLTAGIPALSSASDARLQRRNRLLWSASGIIILALAMAVVSQWWLHRPRNSTVVAVLKPEVSSTTEAVSLARDTVRGALLNGVASLGGLVVLDPSEVDSLDGTAAEIAGAVSAQEIIVSHIEGCNPLCKIQLRRLDVSGQVAPASVKSFDVLADDLLLIDEATTANLLGIYRDHAPRRGFKTTEADPEDFAEFIRVKQEWSSPSLGVTKKDLLEEMVAIRRRSPRFLAAHLEEANAARHLFERSRSTEYLEQARGAIERALHLAPRDARVLAKAVDVSRVAGDFDEAERLLDQLATLEPSDIGIISGRARLAQDRGDSATAVALFETAVRMRPSWPSLRDLAMAEMLSGQMEPAKTHLREALTLAPGNRSLMSKLGQFELVSGNFERAGQIYSELAESAQGEIYFSNLGLALMMQRRFPEAVGALNKALDLTNSHPAILVNLGDCFTLSGDDEKGREYYELALDAVNAPTNTEGIDAPSVRVRAQCLAHLGQPKKAVRVVQQALRMGPDDPQAHFAAAIVYAVAGDRNAALVHKEKSTELGMAPAWLDLPWFEWLAADEPD